MEQRDNQRLASSLLYGPRVVRTGLDNKGPSLSLEELWQSLDAEIIPPFLRRSLPGIFLTHPPSLYKHIDLPDSRVHEYRLACHGYTGDVVLSLYQGRISLACQYNEMGQNDLGPKSDFQSKLLASLASNLSDPIEVNFLLSSRSEVDDFFDAYQSRPLRLGSLRYNDNSCQEERLEDLVEDCSENLALQMQASSSFADLLARTQGREALADLAEESLLCLEADLNKITEEREWDAAR